jgi:ATP-dependent helicase/nuclease subunit A
VAMTRAADRLIVCGADGLRGRPKNCWYDLIREALGPSLVAEDDGDDKVLLYRKATAQASAPRNAADEETKKAEKLSAPAWLRQPAPPEAPRLAPLAPSAAFDEDIERMAHSSGTAADRQKALARGRLVHRLLQSLPDIVSERRADAAARFLAKAGTDFSEPERAAIAEQIRVILDDKSFAEIFAPGSRAEVPIVGRIPRPPAEALAVAGQVDRLSVTADTVLIADYKSDRVVPRSLDEVEAYVSQLALYRAVLSRLYPGKTVRAALIFTAGPAVMDVPAADLDSALAAVLANIP